MQPAAPLHSVGVAMDDEADTDASPMHFDRKQDGAKHPLDGYDNETQTHVRISADSDAVSGGPNLERVQRNTFASISVGEVVTLASTSEPIHFEVNEASRGVVHAMNRESTRCSS